MEIEDIRQICFANKGITEDIKWGHDLVFSIGSKMFCVIGLDQQPTSASFKVLDEEFVEISGWPGFKPAPYVAKYKWVWVDDINRLSVEQWKHYTQQSYSLVKGKLPAKVRKQLDEL
jgi:predicted DNA-binding protein (MmcQ/YjbR family)